LEDLLQFEATHAISHRYLVMLTSFGQILAEFSQNFLRGEDSEEEVLDTVDLVERGPSLLKECGVKHCVILQAH
jgi:hypothetical protein